MGPGGEISFEASFLWKTWGEVCFELSFQGEMSKFSFGGKMGGRS